MIEHRLIKSRVILTLMNKYWGEMMENGINK
jgi:hypothetical protein